MVKGSFAYGTLTCEGVVINNLVLASAVILFFYGLLTEKNFDAAFIVFSAIANTWEKFICFLFDSYEFYQHMD